MRQVQTPPIRTIKTPIRLLITRITALNTPRIAHLIESRRHEICESVLFSLSYFHIADNPLVRTNWVAY
jgi:hypothetical protein